MNRGIRRAMQIVAIAMLSYLMSQAYGFHGLIITTICLAIVVYAIISGDD